MFCSAVIAVATALMLLPMMPQMMICSVPTVSCIKCQSAVWFCCCELAKIVEQWKIYKYNNCIQMQKIGWKVCNDFWNSCIFSLLSARWRCSKVNSQKYAMSFDKNDMFSFLRLHRPSNISFHNELYKMSQGLSKFFAVQPVCCWLSIFPHRTT